MEAFLSPLARIFAGVALLLVFFSTGFVLLRLVKMECDANERYVYAFGIGAGAWGMLMFLLAATSLLYPWLIAGLLLMAVIAAILKRKMFSPLPALHLPSFSWVDRSLITLLFLHIVFQYVLTFLPPTDNVGNDGIAYHLPVPKIYLANHSFVYLPFIFHSNWPFLGEMLYAAGLAVFPDGTLSVQMHWFAGVACLAILYQMSKYFVASRAWGLIAVLSFATLQPTRFQMHSAYIDLFTSMYILLAWMVVLNMQRHHATYHGFVLLGVFIGFAASTKLTAPVYCLGIPFLAVAPLLAAKHIRKPALMIVLTGIVSILVVMPWYLKSFLYTGNPFWPFGYAVFGGKYLDETYAATIATFFDRYLFLKGFTGFLRLPIEMIKAELFSDAPKYLVAAACAALLTVPWTWKKWNVSLRMTVLFILWGTIVWFITSQQIRFLLPFLGLLALLVVVQCEQVLRTPGWKKYAGYACAILIIIPGVYRIPFTSIADYRHLGIALGYADREEYVRGVEPYTMSVFLNSHMQDPERAALIGEVNGFYIDRDYIWTGFNTAGYFDLNRCPVDSVASKFRREGISHIVLRLDKKESELEEPARTAVEEILTKSQRVYSDQWYEVYRLRLP
jgi:hypothetical protein